MLQVIDSSQNTYDAIVVGSGATGGWAAKVLTEAGLKVCVLEAGPPTTPEEFTEHAQPYDYKYRMTKPVKSPMQPMQSKVYAHRESNQKWFVNDIENPYTTPKDKPFNWIRQRRLGGRSLSWGRQSYRLSPLDLQAADHDGYGMNWPIKYGELVPSYEKVERAIGISGRAENLPQLPDSIFQPPMGLSCAEQLLRDRVGQKMGRTVTIGRVAVLTQSLNGRPACHYCGPCEQGCITNSYYASPWTTLKDAADTGNLTIMTDAPAAHVVMDKATGRASGVAYVDASTRTSREVRAKVVVMCASTIESTRLLLNSAPGGLANSSGVLGHYLMDHIYHSRANGEFPELPKGQAWYGPPRRPNGLYIPRFRNVDRSSTNGFIRGYGYQGGGFPAFAYNSPGFGSKFKNAVRSESAWPIGLHGFHECLARYENHISIDDSVRDAWGIPVPRISMTWSDNELALWEDSRIQGAEMLEAAGAKNVVIGGEPSVPGFGIHEMGSARMGADPKRSVLDKWNQTHDISNVFVTDGSAFTSIGCVNPTLTMMALTVRACERIIERGRQGEFG